MQKRISIQSCFIVIAVLLVSSGAAQEISLAGEWRFAIDRKEAGEKERWFEKKLPETIRLPGSMAENGKGDDVTIKTRWTGSIYDSSFFFRPELAKYRTNDNLKIPFWLTPAKHYVGWAWYQKEIIIPEEWKDRELRLFLERVHIQSRVWVDSREAGACNSLGTPHRFDLGKLGPGKHLITVRIDNSIKNMNVGPDSHSVSDHTQGNWNGIIGKMTLEALAEVQIYTVRVFPDIRNKQARVYISLLHRGTKPARAVVTAAAESFNSNILQQTKEVFDNISVAPGDTTRLELTLPMTEDVLLWNEFNPAMYRLTVRMKTGNFQETRKIDFALREFTVSGKQFLVNGEPVFLRGTINDCEFPLTGYPSMDLKAWERIFRIAKEHGLNHMRFHSWCPPAAAFDAADRVGFYLQPEASTWPNHGTSLGDGRFIDNYVYDETKRMMDEYGNHPSYAMMAAGNEPAGRNQAGYLAQYVNYWKEKDSRRVYTGASVAMSWPLVPENQYMVKSGPRGLRWTNTIPESVTNYYDAVKDFSVPYVTHEMGQWCVYPNFEEIKKYTGVYKARNFELFRENLAEHGMGDQARDFLMASGKLQALCYKAEIEKDLRTPGLAGFQLLSLTDFPGQGTALVGLLDAFWDSKPYFRARQFKRFCNHTVLLAELPKFVFTGNEMLRAGIQLFNYGDVALEKVTVDWYIINDKSDTIKRGSFSPASFKRGANLPVGKIELGLDQLPSPAHYKLATSIRNMPVANDWDFWVYPASIGNGQNTASRNVYETSAWDDKTAKVLSEGGTVFLNASGKIVKGREIEMYFTPVFWNTSWFKMRPPHVTGMLVRSEHPAFRDFPTAYHSDYQWWGIANKAQVMNLEDFPAGFRPLVQPIDTWFMNRRLALILEARVGKGRLLITSADLSANSNDPAARQLYQSLMHYLRSPGSTDTPSVDMNLINELFTSPSREKWDSFTRDSPDELKPIKNPGQ